MNHILTKVPLFAGLDEAELAELASIISECQIEAGELIVKQNTTGDEVYIIQDGTVEVFVEGLQAEHTLVLLGKGQIVGEMSLLDQGYRSASVRATHTHGCTLAVLRGTDFRVLCERNHHIGYVVMRNLATDIAFKLRHRNLTAM